MDSNGVMGDFLRNSERRAKADATARKSAPRWALWGGKLWHRAACYVDDGSALMMDSAEKSARRRERQHGKRNVRRWRCGQCLCVYVRDTLPEPTTLAAAPASWAFENRRK